MTSQAPPHTWLGGLAAHLTRRFRGHELQSAITGPGWISLKIDGQFLWIIARGDLRLAWTSAEPVPHVWLELLQRHRRSPFSGHLIGRNIAEVGVLREPADKADGLGIRMTDGAALRARFWPRPGALWLQDPTGEILAQLGRMQGEELEFGEGEGEFDALAHATLCRTLLRESLTLRSSRVLLQRGEQELRRTTRRVEKLRQEQDDALREANARGQADLLAAHLHSVKAGQKEIHLTDFEGQPVILELDPALSPSANLDRWYKRAARAERKREEVSQRRIDNEKMAKQLAARVQAMQAMKEATLEEWLAFAEEHGLEPVPTTPLPASERGRPDPRRVPYWIYRIDGKWELRVGRNARDNDELTQKHSHGRDLWLHAQGVSGSHVVLRNQGAPVPKTVIEKAAQVAAHFSKARTSGTVAVHVTEKRYVRKPRKSPPGRVSVDRGETIFVAPGIPDGVEKER